MKAKLKNYLDTRSRIVIVLAMLAGLFKWMQPGPRTPSSESVATMLGRSIGGSVQTNDFVWEPSAGPWYDLLLGRGVIFTGRRTPGAPRDVFRGRLRLDRTGVPLSVASAHSLTNTRLADEGNLVAGIQSVAYQTKMDGKIMAITVMGRRKERHRVGIFGAVERWWAHWQHVPLRIHHLVFDHAPPAVQMEPQPPQWVFAIGAPAVAATLTDGVLNKDPSRVDPYGTRAFTVYETSEARPTARPLRIEAPSTPANAPSPILALRSNHQAVQMHVIDTRQLHLGIAVGQRSPHAQTGPGAKGSEPTDRRSTIRARFGGGDTQAMPGAGLVVDGRVLVPLKANAPTLAIDRDGRTFIGIWPQHAAKDPSETTWETIWQAGESLVSAGRLREATHPASTRRRIVLCVTEQAQLLHASAHNVPARTLAEQLIKHGCVEAITLDDTLDPTMTWTTTPQPLREPLLRSHLYLYARAPAPARTDSLRFTVAPGRQPSPNWPPAIFVATTQALGRQITVRALDEERFDWMILPGQREVAARTVQDQLDERQLSRSVLGLGMGVARRSRHRRGLVLQGVATIPLRADLGVLLTTADHSRLLTGVTTETLVPKGDATELLLLMSAGTVRNEARILGALRSRGALCQRTSGFTFIAHARSDNYEPLVRVLADLGCEQVFAMDRGRQTQATVHLDGTESGPQASYEQTTLIGLDPVTPRGRARTLPMRRDSRMSHVPPPSENRPPSPTH